MRVSTRFSDSIHLLAYIKIYADTKLTSDAIARSIETSPVVVRRLMSSLTSRTNHNNARYCSTGTRQTLSQISFSSASLRN